MSLSLSIYVYIYIYRERERDLHMFIHYSEDTQNYPHPRFQAFGRQHFYSDFFSNSAPQPYDMASSSGGALRTLIKQNILNIYKFKMVYTNISKFVKY